MPIASRRLKQETAGTILNQQSAPPLCVNPGYEVEPSLAGETVTLWWGLFDHELFVEHADQRFGPFGPIDGPIPLPRSPSFRKSPADGRFDRIETLAGKLGLPRAALDGPAPVAIPAVV